jgi:hypothetical protein
VGGRVVGGGGGAGVDCVKRAKTVSRLRKDGRADGGKNVRVAMRLAL